MMAEIEAGHVGVVIVKDMSRFGRDYLQVGYYTEMFFPERGIRFIAVVNDVDSKKPSSSNDFLPFLNVMNEWYAKDTSRKIKAIFHSRMEKGERCTPGFNILPPVRINFDYTGSFRVSCLPLFYTAA